MSYKAIPAVRMKIKDMSLMENRNLLVLRCLLNSTEDIYARIAAILEIHRSVDNLLASAESKILKESQVLICILGMFIEITDDLEYISSKKGTEDFNERCQLAVNLQAALIQIICAFTTSSPDCRKTTIKLFTNPNEDPVISSILLGAFIKNYKATNIVSIVNFPVTNDRLKIFTPE